MQELYLLYHAYEMNGYEETKILGIYTSYENAEQAKQRYLKQSGFCCFPSHCFVIQNYIPDKDMQWQEGFFFSYQKPYQEFQKLSKALCEFLEMQEDWENQEYFELLQEISWKLASSDDIADIAEFTERMTADFLPERKTKEAYLKFSRDIWN